MLTSVLLHVGGLVTVIIVSIIVSIFSSRKKEKKRASFMEQFIPKPQADDTPSYEEPQSFIVNSPETGSMGTGTYDPQHSVGSDVPVPIDPTGKRKKHNKQASANECPKQAAPAIDDTPYSEYSLKDPEAAKRAIIYSEILKPKF